MAKGKKLANGFTKIGSTYLDSRGNVTTRYQYENELAKSQGYKNITEFRQLSKTDQYLQFLSQATKSRGGSKQSHKALDSEFNTKFAKAYRAMRRGNANKPRGAFHQFLVWLKMRDPKADYDVGDTP